VDQQWCRRCVDGRLRALFPEREWNDAGIRRDHLEVDMRRYTIKKHLLLIVVLFAALVALWMTGILPATPPLISN
jgi:hypothetical protein